MAATRHLHILGASGAGTTTLGAVLAQRLRITHLDTDDFLWCPTEPKFQQTRPVCERLQLLEAALADADTGWVLSGSLAGWGDPLVAHFDLVIFLSLPAELRLARLRARERLRYGEAIAPEGPMHQQHVEFMKWAAAYDLGGQETRSRKMHESWLLDIPCPILRLDSSQPVETLASEVEERLAQRGPQARAGNPAAHSDLNPRR